MAKSEGSSIQELRRVMDLEEDPEQFPVCSTREVTLRRKHQRRRQGPGVVRAKGIMLDPRYDEHPLPRTPAQAIGDRLTLDQVLKIV